MKKLTVLLLFSFLAAASVHATLFWYEGFQYNNGSIITNSEYTPPNGPVGTNSLWVRESGTAIPSDLLCINSNLQVAATGGTLISRQDDCFRLLIQTNWALANNGLPGGSGNYGIWTNNLGSGANNTPGLIYASFTVICTNLPNGPGSYFASFYNTDYGYCGRVLAFTNGTVLPHTWRLAISDNASTATTAPANGGFPVDLALNTPYQVVMEFDPSTLQAATIWVNPININQTGASPVDPSYTASDASNSALTNALNAFAFRQASSFGNSFFLITNLATASTFAEAATNVWATNAVPPTFPYQPISYYTNFANSTFTLSAVANGQGLASMTYQWQVAGSTNSSGLVSPANISSGDLSANNNILTFNGAQAGDSGYYDLIATTPYGLSTTSSISQVAIVTGPYPPQFVSQPSSVQIFTGQSASMSVTVSTPGTPSYTWYSNNVVVSSSSSPSPQETDNGNTSTFSFNNAQTNYSATYKVAITNNLTLNGIVSGNAVLTVLNPAQVSIAFLRTLVSATAASGAYFPTNSPPTIPYQVTGTVTTFTNLTSGNTSSYYLQDGTAGINIFVTGGSTFRPAEGDVVTYIGVLSGFTSGLELYADSADNSFPYTSYVDTGTTNAAPVPLIMSWNILTNIPFANTNLAGRLVQLTNVYFGTNAGATISTSANQVVAVTNGSGQTFNLEFFDLDLNTAGQTLPTNAISVTGVLYGINTNFDLAVTRMIDIVTNVPVTVLIPTIAPKITGFSLGSGAQSGNVFINATNGQTSGTYYLLSSTNVTLPRVQWTPVATNVVSTSGANGAFSFTGTNAVMLNAQQFYILSSTN